MQRIDATVGHDHFTRVDQYTGIAHANGNLPAQRLETRAEHVTERARAVKAGDLGNLLVQGTHRQVVDMRHRSAERKYTIAARFGEHLLDDAGTGHKTRALHPGDVGGLRSQGRRLVHIVARLRPRTDQPLIFEIGIGLQHRGMADIELGAHLAHGGYPLAWLVDTTADVIGQLLGDTLVQQQVGHGGRLVVLVRLDDGKGYRNSCKVYWDRMQHSRQYNSVITIETIKPTKRRAAWRPFFESNSARRREPALVVGKHDFYPTVLRPAPLRGVGLDRVLVAIALRSTSMSATACARSRDSFRLSSAAPVLSV